MYKKYKGLKLTLQDIDVMEAKHGKLPVLDKARAFIFFNDGNYDGAMKLYKKYLISYPDDIDSLLHIGCIYEKIRITKRQSPYTKNFINTIKETCCFFINFYACIFII
ncbi:MAG: tetratricopeptide repeat protein [Candidatus Avigastranaerophilus sp.]